MSFSSRSVFLPTLAAAVAAALLVCDVASAAAPPPVASPAVTTARGLRLSTPTNSLTLQVPLFQSQTVTLDAPASRVSIANPEVADLVVISSTEFYVLAKDIGMTNVLIWDRSNQVTSTVDVQVTHDLGGLRRKIAEVLPGAAIEVRASQRSIVLSGHVPDAATAETATRIAHTFLAQASSTGKPDGGKGGGQGGGQGGGSDGDVINLLEIGGAQQVMLQVKVAEIARTELKRLNARFNSMGLTGNFTIGGVNGGATFPDAVYGSSSGVRQSLLNGLPITGPAVDEFAPTALSIPDQGLFASYLSRNFLFNLAIDAAREQGLAKILAEPTLTTLTGQEARFLSGGEFPIPVPQGSNQGITISFKEYGVSLKMLPTVLSSGQINVRLDVAVSELQSGSSVVLSSAGSNTAFSVPSLNKRSASGTVELADGQTIALAGLINESMRSIVTKFPGLGELPVLGALFRSQQWQKGETELVILVTPKLAKPIDPAQIKLPTDGYREVTDWEFFGLGRQTSQQSSKP